MSGLINKRRFVKTGILGFAGICCIRDFSLFGNKPQGTSLKSTLSKDLWKWSKEASHYIQTARGVKCLICPNECTLKEGELSTCNNRVNVGGKLYTIAYGNPCAVHIDPIEKKPLFHFLPQSSAFSVATAGCNLACLNCQNWTISQTSPRKTSNYDLMPGALVEQALKNKCESIAYTYSEPITFYEYTYDSSKLAHEKGIKNVLVTAGYINDKPLRELSRHIDAANVDLKSFSDSIYLKLNGGTLQPVLNTLKALKETGVWLEITNLIVPSWTDDFDMIKKMCDWLYNNDLYDYPLHFSRFHPQYKLLHLPATPVATLDKAREIALNAGIKFVYIGNVPGTRAEDTNCPRCKRTLIERKGYKILANNIVNNKCKYCGENIPGVWNA
jgi:pyruvate formate lyase activating enzyme